MAPVAQPFLAVWFAKQGNTGSKACATTIDFPLQPLRTPFG
ncbi:hypothetical protein SBA4_5330002 [Candidatus Sulfopaludibacter sp. SbA4]|nr:hypothetical protein SBA4_5330002 [Candidatus Sulfopaludibacter sp. SbA4]